MKVCGHCKLYTCRKLDANLLVSQEQICMTAASNESLYQTCCNCIACHCKFDADLKFWMQQTCLQAVLSQNSRLKFVLFYVGKLQVFIRLDNITMGLPDAICFDTDRSEVSIKRN